MKRLAFAAFAVNILGLADAETITFDTTPAGAAILSKTLISKRATAKVGQLAPRTILTCWLQRAADPRKS